ncbi:hypothetical protein ASC95_06990 [Pelomonas sp. Root1217]|uniref:hypothetical protein n=1 Tax=Pelomonas sp. Root1217 TaxID=1736430 RepID=UPI00070E9821|nr:hypothetical protein [Pelomonas sp. Root1217]KQV61138.1 hypothetical protein ASC95_06990 [Pelomonas sp. Root1217]
MLKTLTASVLVTFLLVLGGAAHAQTSCVADFSAFGQGRITVEIKPRQDGRFDAVVNGSTTNAGLVPVDEAIRAGLNLAADPHGKEIVQFNASERSLVHLHGLREGAATRGVITLPFSPADVRLLRTFDLTGKTDKFGGQVLLEAFDEQGASLGKVLRRVFVATCR